MEKDILLGIDVGTTSLRAGFYRTDGTVVGFATGEYELLCPGPSRAEQRCEDWLAALEAAVKKGIRELCIPPERIAALAVASTCCSVVVCSSAGKPLQNCIMWMDIRAAGEAEEIADKTGEHLSAEWMPCKLLWMKRNRKDIYESAEIFCECQDWLTYQLTGVWSVNVNTACNWGYNAKEGGFPVWFYEKIGLADALEKFPFDRCYRVGEKIGTLTREAANRLGLLPDTLIAQGGVDSSVGILGMGICEPGRMALMTGSSNLAMLLTEKGMFGESTINAGPDHLLPGFFTSFRGQLSSNSIIEWFRNNICDAGEDAGFFDEMEKMAVRLPPGSEGLLVLDYWQGNRHPYYDSRVRGMIYGLSLNHTKAHIYRAVLEGISYGTQNLLEQFTNNGFEVTDIHISGGTSNSRLFMQIQADISNIRIHVPADKQAVCKGAAICAAAAAGIYPSLQEGVRHMVTFCEVIEPDPQMHKIYKAIYQQYKSVYPLMKDWMHRTTEVTGGMN